MMARYAAKSMKQTKYLKCACQHCGGRIEFPADVIGQLVDCPHCQQRTELTLAPPPEADTPEGPAKGQSWRVAGVVILLIGVIGVAVGMMWLKRIAQRKQRPATAAASVAAEKPSSPQSAPAADRSKTSTDTLTVSPIVLDKAKGTLIYATGRVKNGSDRQRFGVKVELDLFDKADLKVGTASDYLPVLEPKAEWHFKALVIEPKAASAKLASIREDQ